MNLVLQIPYLTAFFYSTFKAILKHENHPGIAAIRKVNDNFCFRFNKVSFKEVYKMIKNNKFTEIYTEYSYSYQNAFLQFLLTIFVGFLIILLKLVKFRKITPAKNNGFHESITIQIPTWVYTKA